MIQIDSEFKALIPPLKKEEFEQLEQNILADGCRDPLTTWQGFIIDGHNRYEICTKHSIEFKTVEVDLPSRESVFDWMDENQLGRRNLTPEQMSLLRGRIYNRSKKASTGRADREFGVAKFTTPKTGEVLANKFGVSERTVRNDGKFAESVEDLKEYVPDVESRVLSGEVKKRDIVEAAQVIKNLPEEERKQLKETGGETIEKIKHVHVSANSGNNEWYTPSLYIDLARKAMGGIDTDPATSEIANKTVNAPIYFTAETDGRNQKWEGNVWLNPPYAQPLMGEFAEAVTSKYLAGEIKQACVLVNNATETGWFQRMLDAATAVAFTKGRIRYINPQGQAANSPLQGQAIVYMGENIAEFKSAFSDHAKVLING